MSEPVVSIKEAFENAPAVEMDSGLVTVRASDVTPKPVDWLWSNRLALGKVHTIAGEGGLSKSMLLCWVAATVSRGGEWPNNEGQSRVGSVLILSAEDDIDDTIVPRLMAANADTSKIHIIRAVRDGGSSRSFSLQADLKTLEAFIDELGDVALVIIDPVTSYLGKVDSHKNAEVRGTLEPMGDLAARKHVAIICNNHLSKGAAVNANNRVMGSVAFTAHSRAVTIIARAESTDGDDATDRRLFLPSKMNLGPLPPSLSYRIGLTTIYLQADEVLPAPRIEWEPGTVNISADEAIQAAGDDEETRSALAEAAAFLEAELSAGRRSASDMQKAYRIDGHSDRTIKRARQRLGVISRRIDGEWWWRLPDLEAKNKGANPHQGGQSDDPWPPYQNTQETAKNRPEIEPETMKGANKHTLAPLAPLPDGTDGGEAEASQRKTLHLSPESEQHIVEKYGNDNDWRHKT